MAKLSLREVLYLRNTNFLAAPLRQVLDATQPRPDGTCVVEASRELAETFRDAFTERLAKHGFNSSYELTAEGEMLEGLIDKFGSQT